MQQFSNQPEYYIEMNMRENEEIETWEKLKNWKYNTYWILTFDITERIMIRWNELTMHMMMRMNWTDWNKPSETWHKRPNSNSARQVPTYTYYYNSSLKSSQTDSLSNWNHAWSTYNLRPAQRCAAPALGTLKHAPSRLMKFWMSPLNWQLQYVHNTAPTLTFNYLAFVRNWTTLQHQELMIHTYHTTLTFEYWNWTGNLLENDLNFYKLN